MSKVWFVTGSSRGLGRAIVEHALEGGDQVVATARRPELLDEFVEQHGDRVKPVALDVTDAAQAERAVYEAVEAFGRLDVVVNNAGYADIAAVEDVKAALPILREQGPGHIFQVSSLSARIAGVGLAAYQSAKWAVSGFSTGVAQEVAPFGVKVTVLEPSGMATDWAGASMTIPPVSEPYQPIIGTFAEMVRDVSGQRADRRCPGRRGRRRPSRPRRRPLRLLLGADAVQYAGDAAKQLADSDARWRELSESVVA